MDARGAWAVRAGPLETPLARSAILISTMASLSRPSPSRLTLIEQSGDRAGREHYLDDGEVLLGRDEACDIRFDAREGGVSRRQAVIRAEGDGFSLSDRASANGTFVNGARVASTWLRDGDVIQLGDNGPQLRVRIGAPSKAAPPASEPAVTPRKGLADATFFDPTRHREKRPSGTLGIVVLVGMMFVGLGAGLLVALISAFSLGIGAALVGICMAFIPAPIYLALWLWLDRYDPEPAWAIGGVLLWGAGTATFVAVIFNSVFGAVAMQVSGSPGLSENLTASISAPFVEEAAKGLAVLIVFLVLRREFDGVLDGIVYAGIVALGFAATENVLYYGRSVKGGAGALLAVFVIRGILGPFAHAVFTSMTGIGCGLARQSHNAFVRIVAPIGGYACAVFLHFMWNTLAWISGTALNFLLVYLLVWVPLFVVLLGFMLWIGFREARLIRRMLNGEVARGLLSAQQADIVSSWPKRVSWILGSITNPSRLRARRAFLRAASRLALSYWHAESAAAAGDHTISGGFIPGFRADVARLASQV